MRVHVAWHGGWCWKKLTPLLHSAGDPVYAPTLTGLGERSHLLTREVDLDTHITDIEALFHYEDIHDAVLVGHSYGGMVVAGVAPSLVARLARVIYLDAFLPDDGNALQDYVPLQAPEGAWRLPPPGKPPRFGVKDPADIAWMEARLTDQPLQHVLGAAKRPCYSATKHGSNLVQPILERSDHAEIGAAAARCPEEVGMLGAGGDQQAAIGGDDVDGFEIVARQAVPAAEPPDTAAQGQTGDPGRRDNAGGRGQAESLAVAVKLRQGQARISSGLPPRGFDAAALHPREIDHQPAVAHCLAGHVVPTAPYGDLERLRPRESDAGDHIGRACTLSDQGRPPVDHGVEDPPGVIVFGVVGNQDVTTKRGAELVERAFLDHLCFPLRISYETAPVLKRLRQPFGLTPSARRKDTRIVSWLRAEPDHPPGPRSHARQPAHQLRVAPRVVGPIDAGDDQNRRRPTGRNSFRRM